MSDPIGAINSSTSAASTDPSAPRLPVQTLTQKDFISLLVAQLTTQDPLNPQKDTEFISQMAQFSALQNSQALENDMQTVRATQLLGKIVEVKTSDGNTAKGMVTAVDSSSGDPQIIIGSQSYSLGDIVRVDQAASKQFTTTPTQTGPYKGYSPS
jgi:flagellar basal-body rod modification protein FlgD